LVFQKDLKKEELREMRNLRRKRDRLTDDPDSALVLQNDETLVHHNFSNYGF
jgi:hypothetical protein